MTNESTDITTEILADLADGADFSLDLVAAKDGNEAALKRLQEPRTLEKEFPGSRQRAMGHALSLVEDLEELGIETEREYIEMSLESDEVTLHRIDIHINGAAQTPHGLPSDNGS